MDQIPGGFWRPVAEAFIQRQIKKSFFGRAYLVFGECLSLWAYMMELGGILAAKHADQPDALVSALMGMTGAPGVAKRALIEGADRILARHSLDSMTFWDYVAADIGERSGLKVDEVTAQADRMLAQRLAKHSLGPVTLSDNKRNFWSSLIMVKGAEKMQPRLALTNSWEYASAGVDLGATHPDIVQGMFERQHKPVSKESWQQAYASGLDIGPEPSPASYADYAESAQLEDKNFMEYCQQFCPDLYPVLKGETKAHVVIADKSVRSESARPGGHKISEIPQEESDGEGGIKPDEPIDWRKVAFGPADVSHGAWLIRSGSRDYQSWSEQMVRRYGESVQEKLSEIYTKAKIQAAAADAMQEESRQLLGPSVWRPLEDAAWSSESVRGDAMLPLRNTYADLRTWDAERLRFAVEGIAVLYVNVIVAEMPLPEEIRTQCGDAMNQPQALEAAQAATSAAYEAAREPHTGALETARVADQMGWAVAEASWGPMRAAWTLTELASGAAKAAEAARKRGADSDDVLRQACRIWVTAAEWSERHVQQSSKIQGIIKEGPQRIGPTIDACCEDPNQKDFAQALLDVALKDYFLLQLAMFGNTKVNVYVTINKWKNAGLKLPAEGTPEFYPY
jgi:hypothetical protein